MEEEKDPFGILIIKNNNIFLLDGKLGITERLCLMGEYFFSQYDSVEKGRIKDSSLIVGSLFRNEKLSFQANYRSLGKDFHFIGSSYQTATNHEGIYVDGNLRLKKLYLYGSTDYFWDEPKPEMQRNRLSTWSSHLGASYYPKGTRYFNLSTSIIKKNTSNGPNPIEDLRYNIFLGTSGYFAKNSINQYVRLSYREDRKELPIRNVEKEPNAIVGLRWRLSRRLNMEWEAEVRDVSNSLRTKDEQIQSIDFFLRWQPLGSRFYLNPGVEYTRTNDDVLDQIRNKITFSLSYGHQFHGGWRTSLNSRWSRYSGFPERSYLDFFINLEKVFRWGRPRLRQGIPQPGQKLICGNIKGHLFIDENGDKERQPWEKGIPDIPIILDDRFISVTDAKGEFFFDNVLVGKRNLSIEMKALPVEYLPHLIQQEAAIKVRKTTQVFFPVKIQPE